MIAAKYKYCQFGSRRPIEVSGAVLNKLLSIGNSGHRIDKLWQRVREAVGGVKWLVVSAVLYEQCLNL